LSPLTKVFAVLVTVLAIGLSMVFIVYAAETPRWRQMYQDEKAARDAAEEKLAVNESLYNAQLRDKDAVIDSLQQRLAQANTQKRTLESTLEAVRRNLADMTNERDRFKIQNENLAQTVKIQSASLQRRSEQLDALRKQTITLQNQLADLNMRLEELTTNLGLVNERLKRERERVVQLEQENDQLRRKLGEATTAKAVEPGPDQVSLRPPTVSRAPIRGRLTAVKGDLAEISVGSADGVQKGMTFTVYRGADYVAKLVVQEVEPDRSGGRLFRIAMDPKVNDKVADRLED